MWFFFIFTSRFRFANFHENSKCRNEPCANPENVCVCVCRYGRATWPECRRSLDTLDRRTDRRRKPINIFGDDRLVILRGDRRKCFRHPRRALAPAVRAAGRVGPKYILLLCVLSSYTRFYRRIVVGPLSGPCARTPNVTALGTLCATMRASFSRRHPARLRGRATCTVFGPS